MLPAEWGIYPMTLKTDFALEIPKCRGTNQESTAINTMNDWGCSLSRMGQSRIAHGFNRGFKFGIA
jgi:hypothetical protein